MKFTIDRKTWLRGEGGDDSALLRAYDRKMCCLGSVSLQCGINNIFGKSAPCSLKEEEWAKFPEVLRPLKKPVVYAKTTRGTYNDNSDLAAAMMRVNDDEDISDEGREAKLIELCAPHGIELEFVN